MHLLDLLTNQFGEIPNPDNRRAVLDQTFVEHRFHEQQKYVAELEEYASQLETRLYQLQNENLELREQLKNLTIAHSLDELIEAFRKEGEAANNGGDNNIFASLFGARKRNYDDASGSDDSSDGVDENRMTPGQNTLDPIANGQAK